MSGFPGFESFKDTQLVIVHMDDSTSEISFGDDEEPGGDATGWEVTRQAIRVRRRGAYTCFPLTTVKSYTLVYPEEMCEGCEDLNKIVHLDPDNETDEETDEAAEPAD